MADDKGRRDFSDLDMSEIFTDFRTHSDSEDKNGSVNRQKFVVHIDDSVDDSFDYDFAAFSSQSDREKELRRKEESRQSFKQFEEELGEYKSSIQRKQTPQPVQRPQRRTAEYNPPAQRKAAAEKRKTFSEISAKPPEAVKRNVFSQETDFVPKRPQQAAVPEKQSQVLPSENENPSEQPSSATESEKKVVRLRTRSTRGAFTGFTGFICIALVFTLILTSVGLSTIGDIVAYNRGETSVTVVIENDKNGNSPTLERVIDSLHSAGLIKQKTLCLLFAKFRHYDGYTNNENVWVPAEYLSGVYYLEPELGLEGMLNTIKKSTSKGEYTVTLTFPEGWTVSQIFERLEKNGVCEASKLYANIETVAKQYNFYYDINRSGVRYLGVEGYLFPDTYEFFKNENAVSVLRKFFDNADAKWTKEYQRRAKALGYTRDEILNIASIIQREAANKSQMSDVSSVIHNRLSSSTYPSLQCNSTLDYVTNSVKSHVDATLAEIYAGAYNTYRCEGLPPGPICNPGKDAIEAALNPGDTNYYFFVHNNDGKIYLSDNYAQFQKDSVQVAKDNAS